jgi:hypothetical protein
VIFVAQCVIVPCRTTQNGGFAKAALRDPPEARVEWYRAAAQQRTAGQSPRSQTTGNANRPLAGHITAWDSSIPPQVSFPGSEA